MKFSTALLFPLFLATQILSAENWNEFRGPSGQGLSKKSDVPLIWSDSENVKWRKDVPGLGWSSPVYSNNRIWLTTSMGDGTELRVLCFDLESGELQHNIPVFENNTPKSIHGKNSHASPTPLIEDDRVYVHFGTYGTACITTAGEIVWRTKLDYEPQHGPGGSPAIHGDLLIVNCDGTDVQYVAALNKATGDTVWKTLRTHASEARLTGKKSPPMAFSTPLIIEFNGQYQVISAGSDHVAAYDAATGNEIWWSGYDGYSVVPRPVAGHGMIYVSSCYGPRDYRKNPTFH